MKSRVKKTVRVVPSLIFSASFVGVVPACALTACGGSEQPADGGSDVTNDIQFSVADVGFGVAACCFDANGVADVGFIVPDADASDAPGEGG